MRQRDNDTAAIRGLTRRQYAQILAGASAASIAGCTGDDGDGDGTGDGDDTDGEDTDGGSQLVGDPQREALRIWVPNVPATADMNIYTTSDRTTGQLHLTEMTCPADFVDNTRLLDGHEWPMDHAPDEYNGPDPASVPVCYIDWEVEAPFDTWQYFRGYNGERDPLTYWDGTEINGTQFVESYRLEHYYQGNHRLEGSTFNNDTVDSDGNESDYCWHYWNNRGDVEGQDPNRQGEAILEFDAASDHEYANVMHPDFVNPWVEDFLDSANESEDSELQTAIEGDRVPFERYANEGWGGGPYELDPDSISQASMTLVARRQDIRDEIGSDLELISEHPNEQLRIPEVQIQFASGDRRPILANNGQLDVGESPVLAETGDFNRQNLPPHIQELDRYVSPDFGDFWMMNWNNPHLQRLWVRRAFIAAIDWFDFGLNGWGERSIPSEYVTGVPDPIMLQNVSEDWLEGLHSYPNEQDLDLAADYMERAGYTGGPDQGWTGPDGRDFTLTIEHLSRIGDWTGAHQTAQSHLSQLGVEASVEPLEDAVWNQRRGQGQEGNVATFGAKIMWVPGGPIWNWYATNGSPFAQTIVGGDPGSGDGTTVDPEDLQSDVDNYGRPFVQEVPTEAGAFEAPDEAGISPSPSVETEEVNLAAACQSLESPDLSADEFTATVQQLARYANYYLPLHCFHTLPGAIWGNVRDFSWPQPGHGALRGEKEFAADEYIYQAGVGQLRYQSDFPDPGSRETQE